MGHASRADLLRALSRDDYSRDDSACQVAGPAAPFAMGSRDVSTEQSQHASPAPALSRGTSRRAMSTPVRTAAVGARDAPDAHQDGGAQSSLTCRRDLLRALASGNGSAALAVGAKAPCEMSRNGGNDRDHHQRVDGRGAAATEEQRGSLPARGMAFEAAVRPPMKANSGDAAMHDEVDVDAASALAGCSVLRVHRVLPLPAAAARECRSFDVDDGEAGPSLSRSCRAASPPPSIHGGGDARGMTDVRNDGDDDQHLIRPETHPNGPMGAPASG